MQGFNIWTKHFDGFDVVTQNSTGEAFIISKTDPYNKPLIGPFKTPAEAIEFGMNRVKEKDE